MRGHCDGRTCCRRASLQHLLGHRHWLQALTATNLHLPPTWTVHLPVHVYRSPCCHPRPTHPCSFSLLLSKGARSRFGEDQLVSKLVIKAIADALGVPTEASAACWACNCDLLAGLPAACVPAC